MRFIYILNVLVLAFSAAHGVSIAVPIKTTQKAMDKLGIASDVLGIFDFIMGSSNNNQIDQAKLVSDLQSHIDAAKTEVIASIVLRSKLDRVDDAVIAIQSSLIDVRNILQAQTGVVELVQLFKNRFEEHDVIKHVRFLKTLLTYVSPGDSMDLISLVREGTRCGSESFNAFRSFYLQLIVDGAVLDLLYIALTTDDVDVGTFFVDWVSILIDADTIFSNQIPICNERFPSDVLADLQTNNDPNTLRSELTKRYPDRNIDIFFYSGVGTNQFHAFRYVSANHNFFWDRDLDTVNKMLVVTDNNGKSNWNKAVTKSNLESCVEDVSVDSEDERAAENVLTKVATCTGLEYPVDIVIVYFESDDFGTTAVQTYQDSPMVEVSVEGVKLEYCFDSGFMCTFSSDESEGRFRIFVYPRFDDGVSESDYVIGGSEGIRPLFWPAVASALLSITIISIYH